MIRRMLEKDSGGGQRMGDGGSYQRRSPRKTRDATAPAMSCTRPAGPERASPRDAKQAPRSQELTHADQPSGRVHVVECREGEHRVERAGLQERFVEKVAEYIRDVACLGAPPREINACRVSVDAGHVPNALAKPACEQPLAAPDVENTLSLRR